MVRLISAAGGSHGNAFRHNKWRWEAQSVKNLVVRYRRLTGSSPTRGSRRQRTGKDVLEAPRMPTGVRSR